MTIAAQIHRVLRTVDLDAVGPIVAVQQTFATTVDDLWQACTDPARLARWFEPIAGSLRQDGRYRLADSGTEGTIERCEPPTTSVHGRMAALTVTWEYSGDISRVVATIAAHPEGASLTIQHIGAQDAHWEEFGPASGGMGWDESLLALGLHLEGDPRGEPEALRRELATDAGREFFARSARAWRDAHVAAGASNGSADAASQRSLDAYLAMG